MQEDTKQELVAHLESIIARHELDETAKFEELKTDIQNLRHDMAVFVEAWQQAKGVIYAVKWLASIAGGLTALILFFKDHVK